MEEHEFHEGTAQGCCKHDRDDAECFSGSAAHEPDQAPGNQASEGSGTDSEQNAVGGGRDPFIANNIRQFVAEQDRDQADAGNREQPEFTGGFVQPSLDQNNNTKLCRRTLMTAMALPAPVLPTKLLVNIAQSKVFE